MDDLVQIGEIAKRAGVNIQTLRYYERRKLLSPKVRKDSGYRLYSIETAKQVRFIKHAQELGFTLEEIKALMKLRVSSKERCVSVKMKAQTKLEQTQEKVRKLKGIEKTLKRLIGNCDARKLSSDCPIIDSLET